MTEAVTPARVPVREGLLKGPLDDLDGVRLRGTRCEACGETSLGFRSVCPNCGLSDVRDVALSADGTIWSFTVVRHRPAGAYRGPDPFEPFGLGLVELPEGIRVLSPIRMPVDDLKIGLPVRFRAALRQEENGPDVVIFTFDGGAHA